jgi:ABC-type glycerol-3-phosphate transport system permease component
VKAKVKPAARDPRRRIRKLVRQLPIHIFLIPLCFFWIYPFLWMLSASFKSQEEMFLSGASLIPDEIITDNYVRAWEGANFAQYTVNTVIVTTATVLIVILVASMAGYALGRGKMPGKRLVVGILIATMFLPKGFTILPIFVLINELGLNNSLAGIILVESGSGNVIAILLFMGYFASIPKELEESAIMDGAGHVRIYWQIMLPLAKPVIGTVAIFNFISTWNSFLVPLVFTLTRPDLRTLGVGIYSFAGEFGTDWAGLAAGSVITILPIIVVFLWLQKYFIEGLAGSVKG